jgi:hypothetical protein
VKGNELSGLDRVRIVDAVLISWMPWIRRREEVNRRAPEIAPLLNTDLLL